jgi:hypothetical protein
MTNQSNPNHTLDPQADLGLALLVADDEEHSYEPISAVATLREAEEIAATDFRQRLAAIEAGADLLCPYRYVVWARNGRGHYRILHQIRFTVPPVGEAFPAAGLSPQPARWGGRFER